MPETTLPETTEPQSPSSSPERPASLGRTIVITLLAAAGGFAVTSWADLSRSEVCTGYLQVESTTIIANSRGTLREIQVREGDIIDVDTPVVVLGSETVEAQKSVKQQEVKTLEVELQQLLAKSEIDLAWRTKEVESEILETRLRSTGFHQSLFDQQIEQHAWNDLLGKKHEVAVNVTPQRVFQTAIFKNPLPQETRIRIAIEREASRNAAEVSNAQIELCARRLEQLAALKDDLSNRVRRATGVNVAESNLSQARGELEKLKASQENLELKATAYGTVGVFRKHVGDRVAPGDIVVDILDQDRRFLVVQVPSRGLWNARVGDVVTITFPGKQIRKGSIASIPVETVRSNRDVPARNGADSMVNLRVDPIDKHWPDAPLGTAVKVVLKRR